MKVDKEAQHSNTSCGCVSLFTGAEWNQNRRPKGEEDEEKEEEKVSSPLSEGISFSASLVPPPRKFFSPPPPPPKYIPRTTARKSRAAGGRQGRNRKETLRILAGGIYYSLSTRSSGRLLLQQPTGIIKKNRKCGRQYITFHIPHHPSPSTPSGQQFIFSVPFAIAILFMSPRFRNKLNFLFPSVAAPSSFVGRLIPSPVRTLSVRCPFGELL